MEPAPSSLPALLGAAHLLALVGYFAAVFHLVRLFNAHRHALTKWEPERGALHTPFAGMERRALFGLAWPMLLLLLVTGAWMLWLHPGLIKEPFMMVKLGLVALLFGYQLMVHRVQGRLNAADLNWSGVRLWVFGHGSTLLLVALVLSMALRDHLGWIWGSIGLLVLGGVIAYLIASMRKDREPSENA